MDQLFDKPIYRTSERFKSNLESRRLKQVKYGRNSLNALASILWCSLSTKANKIPFLDEFKIFMQNWGNFLVHFYIFFPQTALL